MKCSLAAAVLLCAAACTRAGEDRALRDQDVGHATAGTVTVDVDDGLAQIRTLAAGAGGGGTLELWAQAPILELTVELDDASAAGTWTVTLDNALADTTITAADGTGSLATIPVPSDRPTIRAWTVELAPGRTTIHLAPPDAADLTAWRFAVMGDIQTAMPTVDDVFTRISAEPGLRFVISTGDVVDRGREDEYQLFEEKLTALTIPFYSTIGNHELWDDIDRWYRRFGRATVHFDFRGVAFSLVDSAAAGIDPTTTAALDGWLAEHTSSLHFFFTHYPPLDPIGVRQGSFASRREAQALLARLSAAGIDATFYGHLHTYTAFENAGMPAYVSGGGGADPMAFDGINRHFLVVDVEPARNTLTSVRVVRVD